MSANYDREFYLRREAQELRRAVIAEGNSARDAHLKLADAYRARAETVAPTSPAH